MSDATNGLPDNDRSVRVETVVEVPETFVDEVVSRVSDNTEHFDVAPLLGE
ncbi:MAG: hypothetical protein ABI083_05075 [Lapillicoccus sp.]